jgi:hypothetical protein
VISGSICIESPHRLPVVELEQCPARERTRSRADLTPPKFAFRRGERIATGMPKGELGRYSLLKTILMGAQRPSAHAEVCVSPARGRVRSGPWVATPVENDSIDQDDGTVTSNPQVHIPVIARYSFGCEVTDSLPHGSTDQSGTRCDRIILKD